MRQQAAEELLEVDRCDLQISFAGRFESPFERTEIHQAIQAGEGKKASGSDGLEREVYSHNWAIIRDNL